MRSLRLAYYADDFTGATDALEALATNGVSTRLFLSAPTPHELADRWQDLEAVGVAGVTRSLPPSAMTKVLRGEIERLRQLQPQILHYKVCSTFDSSPDVGSIGTAADVAADILDPPYIPLVVGVPTLGRYVVFGNLFADHLGQTYRLDRHPTMRNHPITPMGESDLRAHLGEQTQQPIRDVDVLALDGRGQDLDDHLQTLLSKERSIVLFDTLTSDHLNTLGRLVWQHRIRSRPQFVIGSSGVEYALVQHWRGAGSLPAETPKVVPDPVEQLVVVSGSAATNTADQIRWARAAGFVTIRVDPVVLLDDERGPRYLDDLAGRVVRAVRGGANPVIHTAEGSQDPEFISSASQLARLGYGGTELAAALGARLGILAKQLIGATEARRICVAGGDTSGYLIKELGVDSLTWRASIEPGAPLCRISARDPQIDGIEVVLKGGQTGSPSFFEAARSGPDRTERVREPLWAEKQTPS